MSTSLKETFLAYAKHSGIWLGLVVNPYHWQFRIVSSNEDNAIYFGPFWVRVIIDNGRW